MQLKIDPEFRDKIPPLTEAEFKQLEENIVADGEIREPIITWNDVIVDGHHRWQIIQKHPEIPYKVKKMEFVDRYAAIIWMCKEQLGRRNLSDAQQTALIGQRYKAEKMAQGGTGANQHTAEQSGQNVRSATNREIKDGTAGKIGKEYGLSARQVRRAEDYVNGLEVAESVSPGFKEQILTGSIKAPKSTIAEIAKMDEPEKKEAVAAIQRGDKAKKPAELKKAAETRKGNQMLAKIEADLKNMDKPPVSGDTVIREIKNITADYIKNIRWYLAEHGKEFEDAENNKKIISALSEAVTEIEKMKGIISI